MRDLIDGGNDAVFLGIQREKRNMDGDNLSAFDYFDGGYATFGSAVIGAVIASF